MRDPKRIEPMLEAIRRIWTAYPDLRLTQLVVNAARTGVPCPELFYLEDEEMLKRLNAEADRVAIPNPTIIETSEGKIL